MTRFGGSDFVNCSVPLAFEGRFFILESGEPPLVSVICEYGGQPVFEIERNKPSENPLSRVSITPPGIVTVSDKGSGRFLYKVRPSSETSVVFGKLNGEEIDAVITDKLIRVGGITIENCIFDGVSAGIVVDSNGGVKMGTQIPPILLKWFAQ